MKTIIRIIAVAVFVLAFAFEMRAGDHGSYVNEGDKKVVMEIDYGNIRPSRIMEVASVKGKTVLEVLQTVAAVATHPVGKYVFVTSIDGVEGKRGETAWYYTVDDKSSEELAYTKVLNGTERIKWTYKKDVCSGKIDGKAHPSEKGGEKK